MKKLIYSLFVTAALSGVGSGVSAATSDTLFNLSQNSANSVTIGDKTFSNFSYLASGLSGFSAANITVTASVDLSGVYYLTFAGNMSLASAGFATADLLLNYRVSAAPPNTIWMIDQYYTGSAQPAGGAFLAVDETVTAAGGGPILANSHLEVGDLGDPFAEVGDDLIVNPAQASLDVTKDIAFGVINGGFVTISQVRQSFHQVSIPDGGLTIAFLGSAIIGLGLLRRKLS